MKFKRLGKLVTVMVLTAVITGVFIAPATMAKECGWVSEWSDEYDLWGIHNYDENSSTTDYIFGYLGTWIKFWVDPEYPLDVAVGLYVCVDYREPECRRVFYDDDEWDGGKEYSRYYVDWSDFYPIEIDDGYWILAIFAVDNSGDYCIDEY